MFVLGDDSGVFYDDDDLTTDGTNDYALLKDFNRFEDTIQLNGTASDYVVAEVPSSLASAYSGMNVAGIYYDTDDPLRNHDNNENGKRYGPSRKPSKTGHVTIEKRYGKDYYGRALY